MMQPTAACTPAPASRREFVRACARTAGFAAAALTAVRAGLLRRAVPPAAVPGDGPCVGRGWCGRCRALAACAHPRGASARLALAQQEEARP